MPERLIVSFRGVVQPEPESAARYLSRSLAVKKRAEALGATLCAWSAQTFSFSFDLGELEEAVTLAALAWKPLTDTEIQLTLPGIPVEPCFSAGIAEGEMSVLGAAGTFAMLSWGPALVVAVGLARDAQAGEVLLDLDLIAHRATEISLLEGMHVDFGRRRLVRRPTTPRYARQPVAAAGQTQRPPLSRSPLRPPTSRPPGPISGYGSALTDGGRARRAPTLLPPASSSMGGGLPSIRGSAPPPSSGIESAATPSRPPRASSPPPPLAELAKRALLQGDLAAVERLLGQLRDTGEQKELVERMTGLIALRRGATTEALRRLRDAAEAARDPAQQARAQLAYGVALATAGRTESALLEALSALARARAASDPLGERACALFLARLSAAAGHADAASAWAIIASP